MQVIDIILLIFLLFYTYKGFRNGFFIGISSLIGIILGLYAIYHFNEVMINWLQNNMRVESKNIHLIASVLTFLLVIIVVYFLSRFLSSLFKTIGIGFINRISGALLGLLKAVLIASFMFLLIARIDTGTIISEKTKSKSFLYNPVAAFAPKVLPAIKDYTKKTQEFIKNK